MIQPILKAIGIDLIRWGVFKVIKWAKKQRSTKDEESDHTPEQRESSEKPEDNKNIHHRINHRNPPR